MYVLLHILIHFRALHSKRRGLSVAQFTIVTKCFETSHCSYTRRIESFLLYTISYAKLETGAVSETGAQTELRMKNTQISNLNPPLQYPSLRVSHL